MRGAFMFRLLTATLLLHTTTSVLRVDTYSATYTGAKLAVRPERLNQPRRPGDQMSFTGSESFVVEPGPSRPNDATSCVGGTGNYKYVVTVRDKCDAFIHNLDGTILGYISQGEFNTACQRTIAGSPTIDYDFIGNSWIVAAMYTVGGAKPTETGLCVFVSKDGDPVGPWRAYRILHDKVQGISADKPESPKVTFWPSKAANAIVITYQVAGGEWGVYALDRTGLYVERQESLKIKVLKIRLDRPQDAAPNAPLAITAASFRDLDYDKAGVTLTDDFAAVVDMYMPEAIRAIPFDLGVPIIVPDLARRSYNIMELKLDFGFAIGDSIGAGRLGKLTLELTSVPGDKYFVSYLNKFRGNDPTSYVACTYKDYTVDGSEEKTTYLNPLVNRISHRLNFYFNRGEPRLVGTINTPTSASNGATMGVYWFELQRAIITEGQGKWGILQHGRIDTDTAGSDNAPGTHRWASTSDVNQWGDICVGYTVAPPGEGVGLAYSCRNRCDNLNTMRPEVNLVTAATPLPDLKDATLQKRWGNHFSMNALEGDYYRKIWFLTGEVVASQQGSDAIKVLPVIYKFNPELETGKRCGDLGRARNRGGLISGIEVVAA